jgi:phage recombination protein Bet
MSDDMITLARATEAGVDIDLIRHTLMPPGSNDGHLAMFVHTCQRLGLDPLAHHAYALMLKGRLSIQVSIDGFRLVAEQTGDYRGQEGPFWCGPDGVWRDVWLEQAPPAAARVGVMREGWSQPLWGTATFAEYGSDRGLWREKPSVMLAKVAETIALRRAFPARLSGTYSPEMNEPADAPPPLRSPQPVPPAAADPSEAAGGPSSEPDDIPDAEMVPDNPLEPDRVETVVDALFPAPTMPEPPRSAQITPLALEVCWFSRDEGNTISEMSTGAIERYGKHAFRALKELRAGLIVGSVEAELVSTWERHMLYINKTVSERLEDAGG